jgi:tRNA G18 (ribose-2'-O)-methylase SpoU
MLKTTIQEMNRLTPEAYKLVEKVPLIVVLDNVRSQHNIGAVFRTADAFCLQGVYLCGICCCPPNNDIHKTALGAENTVDWKYFDHTSDAIQFLRSNGYTIYAIEQAHGATLLNDLQLNKNQKIAIIMGHEVFGVQQEIVNIADGCIEIPQYGTKHSLNVSVTAGIVMYEISNMLRK